MRCNKAHFTLAVVMLLALTCMIALCSSAYAANPIISVNPSTVTVNQGQNFTVDVVIDNMTNMYAFQISVSFDKTKLAATAIDYDGYLNEPTIELAKVIDNTGGNVIYSRTSTLPAPAKTGGSPPPLATIHFTAIAGGSSILHLYNTILDDNSSLEIPHTNIDGQVTIISTQPHPVGGEWTPINTFSILAPWIALVAALAASGAGVGLFKRRLNREIK